MKIPKLILTIICIIAFLWGSSGISYALKPMAAINSNRAEIATLTKRVAISPKTSPTGNSTWKTIDKVKEYFNTPKVGDESIPFSDEPRFRVLLTLEKSYGITLTFFDDYDGEKKLGNCPLLELDLTTIEGSFFISLKAPRIIPKGHLLLKMLPKLRKYLKNILEQLNLTLIDQIIEGYDEKKLMNTIETTFKETAKEIWKDKYQKIAAGDIFYAFYFINWRGIKNYQDFKNVALKQLLEVGQLGKPAEKFKFMGLWYLKLTDAGIITTGRENSFDTESTLKISPTGLLQELDNIEKNHPYKLHNIAAIIDNAA